MMAARHGTRRRYTDGCRCDDCKDAQRIYQRRYRERLLSGDQNRSPEPDGSGAVNDYTPGPVEVGVQAEIGSLATETRPGLAAVALSLAQLMDDPKARNQQAAAATVLASLLDKLRSASADGRGQLALVKSMTSGHLR